MGTAYNANIVTDGLVLCLDAANPRSYPGSGTTWYDLSGNGNNMTGGIHPSFLYFYDENCGLFRFSGSKFSSSLTTTSLGLSNDSGATISNWLKIDLLNRWTGVIAFWSSAGYARFGWDITPANELRIWKNNSISTSISLSNYDNKWIYYSLVSNSSGTIFYVNNDVLTTTSQAGNIGADSRTLMFGQHWDNGIRGDGSILKIYNKALSQQEIRQNFNATRGRYGI